MRGFYFPPSPGLASAPRPILTFWTVAMATKPGEPYLNRRDAPSQPGDEVVGGWSREQLERMDARFVHAVERAIAREKEHAPKERPRP